jgi:hypothetical protein
MENDFLFCRECIQLTTQTVEVTINYRGTSLICAFENGMLDKVSNTAVVAVFVTDAAFYAEGAVSDR